MIGFFQTFSQGSTSGVSGSNQMSIMTFEPVVFCNAAWTRSGFVDPTLLGKGSKVAQYHTQELFSLRSMEQEGSFQRCKVFRS